MPELPEVDAITGVVRRHAAGNTLTGITSLRGTYFGWKKSGDNWRGRMSIMDVYRVGKHVVLKSQAHWGPQYIIAHNAMTGYFDWQHEPWTFASGNPTTLTSGCCLTSRTERSSGSTIRGCSVE